MTADGEMCRNVLRHAALCSGVVRSVMMMDGAGNDSISGY